MAAGRKTVIGATTAPDVDIDDLDRFGGDWVQPGAAIEHVVVDASTPLEGAIAGSVVISGVLLDHAELASTRLRGVSLRDVIGRGVNAANADWTAARLNRVVLEGSSLTGLQLRESELRDTVFRACKLDYVNFRIADLRNVTFEGCVLTETDFGGARLDRVRFVDCRLHRVELSGVELTDVDMRGSELGVSDAFALRGAIVSPLQLIDLAAPLAQSAGIRVED